MTPSSRSRDDLSTSSQLTRHKRSPSCPPVLSLQLTKLAMMAKTELTRQKKKRNQREVERNQRTPKLMLRRNQRRRNRTRRTFSTNALLRPRESRSPRWRNSRATRSTTLSTNARKLRKRSILRQRSSSTSMLLAGERAPAGSLLASEC